MKPFNSLILYFITVNLIYAQQENSFVKIFNDPESGLIKVKEEQRFAGLIDDGSYKGFASMDFIYTIYFQKIKDLFIQMLTLRHILH